MDIYCQSNCLIVFEGDTENSNIHRKSALRTIVMDSSKEEDSPFSIDWSIFGTLKPCLKGTFLDTFLETPKLDLRGTTSFHWGGYLPMSSILSTDPINKDMIFVVGLTGKGFDVYTLSPTGLSSCVTISFETFGLSEQSKDFMGFFVMGTLLVLLVRKCQSVHPRSLSSFDDVPCLSAMAVDLTSDDRHIIEVSGPDCFQVYGWYPYGNRADHFWFDPYTKTLCLTRSPPPSHSGATTPEEDKVFVFHIERKVDDLGTTLLCIEEPEMLDQPPPRPKWMPYRHTHTILLDERIEEIEEIEEIESSSTQSKKTLTHRIRLEFDPLRGMRMHLEYRVC